MKHVSHNASHNCLVKQKPAFWFSETSIETRLINATFLKFIKGFTNSLHLAHYSTNNWFFLYLIV